MTLWELISTLHVQPTKAHCIRHLMCILIHFGLFELRDLEEVDGQMGYVLTCVSQLLVKDKALSAAPFALFLLRPLAKGHCAWMRDGEDVHPTTYEMAHSVPAWDALRNLKANSLFNEAMASDSSLIARVVVDTCGGVFEGLSLVVEVGGRTGMMGKAITEAFLHLECTVFDQPHMVDGLVGTERLKFVGGDLFVEITLVDAVILKVGKVVMIDMVVGSETEDHGSTETQLFFDMLMMVTFNVKERDEK
ncbi:hypothetical protein EUGRSUZ_H03086 [Eucalyptus grandis]|uniref:O-methyltransferase C-terminal domain-containing protein n=2 Tax=Eucalyptus grandis TaxID=71139 RepID=A0A059B3A7_EUCGR|nr:hypothetical protein EUGRSUZ_H03086 [Eucalyptus grandis]